MPLPPNDVMWVFASGVALGGMVGALAIGAYAWDLGYLAGERDTLRRYNETRAANQAIFDGIGEVL